MERSEERVREGTDGRDATEGRNAHPEGRNADPEGRASDPAGEAADARLERMDRVAVLYAEITAATRAFLAALAESDRHRDWAAEGFGSCAEWLAWRIGVTRNTANEKVRAARALEELPLTAAAMARGELSFSKVRALTRAATPENEAELLELAHAASAAHLERMIRGWRRLERGDEAARERRRHATRYLSVFPDEDGMYELRGRLPAEVGAVLMRAIEAASDALYRTEARRGEAEPAEAEHAEPPAAESDPGESGPTESDPAEGDPAEGDPTAGDPTAGDPADAPGHGAMATPATPSPADPGPDPRQRRADALGLLAERALAFGFHGRAGGSRAERYQVMLHVQAEGLTKNGQADLSELDDGTRIAAETARRIACDAARVRVRTDAAGSILDVGRRTRTVPAALRRALEARDRGCRFPGCVSRFTDAHHIVHWADGGETSLPNTLLLCSHHHRRVHEEGWRVCTDKTGAAAVFFTPEGKALAGAPALPGVASEPRTASEPRMASEPNMASGPQPDPAAPLRHRNRARGVHPTPRTGAPRWKRDADIPWAVEAAALEALDASESREPLDTGEALHRSEAA